MASPTTNNVQNPGIDYDQALEGMRETFEQAINRNLEVNQLSTEGRTAIEAARNKPLG